MGSLSKIPVKRNAVKLAFTEVQKQAKLGNVPCVKKAFGQGIVRVCCRNIVQLENIPIILEKLMEFKLIEEIGMPLEYNYKMKTLVLFLKPTNVESSTMMDKVFQQCNFGYSHVVIEVPYPTTAAKNVFEKKTNTMGENFKNEGSRKKR